MKINIFISNLYSCIFAQNFKMIYEEKLDIPTFGNDSALPFKSNFVLSESGCYFVTFMTIFYCFISVIGQLLIFLLFTGQSRGKHFLH